MLLPALSKSRDKGRLTSCANNMKQIGLSAALHQNDTTVIFK